MNKRITITGADNSVDPVELTKYKGVEWGILFSKSRSGTTRYPDLKWLEELANVARTKGVKLRLSAHLCGEYVRDLARVKGEKEVGTVMWLEEFKAIHSIFQRVQINSGINPPAGAEVEYTRSISSLNREIIVQTDGNSGAHYYFLQMHGFKVSALVDQSGGRGIEQIFTPPLFDANFGFAGGISPANISVKIEEIEAMGLPGYWVDMESGVRTIDSHGVDKFDLSKVESIVNSFNDGITG